MDGLSDGVLVGSAVGRVDKTKEGFEVSSSVGR